MKRENNNENLIVNISSTNIHHQSNTSSPVYSIIQLESGLIAIGLKNGSIRFYSQQNFEKPYSTLQIDSLPINSIIQLHDNQLMCCCGSLIYLIFENNLKKYDYNKKEKVVIQNIHGKINKIILLPDESIISGDSKYVSSLRKKGKKINITKQIKIGSPVLDLLLIQNNMFLAAAPQKQSLSFIDIDKFAQNYEIKNIKFFGDIKMNNIILKIKKDLLVLGGCKGIIYLINLKNKQFVANINIRYKNEIITSMYKMSNGDLLCGISMLLKEDNSQKEYICCNLVQFRYENNIFKEIYRKANAHNDVIKKICEIVNHKGISEIGTISLDSTFKVWD